MIRILLLGPKGQVGWELQRALAPLGELICLDRHSQQRCGDLTKLDGLARTVAELRPSAIVNAAAYTAVDKAESEPELAWRINAEAPGVLARAAAACGAWLIHYSTDYVFDGSGSEPWDELATPAPLNQYGRSKLGGEQAIAASACQYVILRTQWVYAARGGNFIKTMLRLAREREQLEVVADQVGAPTGAELIADVSAQVLRAVQNNPALGGLYHLAAGGHTTWYAYAAYAIDGARRRQPHLPWALKTLSPIASSHYPTPAQRPANGLLDTRKLCQAFGLAMPPWQAGVDRLLDELLEPT
jgi:dTDP-4-dehydrorhamnose reductase